jgi:glycosyltransferase involved in cell wall biosynthesis
MHPPVKLVIQIPCLNERDQLAETISDLPRAIEGVDAIEVLVIDDGSVDGTAETAKALGVHHVVRFPQHRGLSAAFMAGIDVSLRLGADVIVNTDADNQYHGAAIATLVGPILRKQADVVIGDRQLRNCPRTSWSRKLLQHWGSMLVRRVAGVPVADATSGFRAFSRGAALRLFVHNPFTYTLETIIQGGRSGQAFENVVVATNPPRRHSRLFASVARYVRRNAAVILRTYAMYRPVRTLGIFSAGLFCAGALLTGRFLWLYAADPARGGHTQSLVVGTACLALSLQVGLAALLSDLIATNRRLSEDALEHVRRIDAALTSSALRNGDVIDGVESTGHRPWGAGAAAAEQAASRPIRVASASREPRK